MSYESKGLAATIVHPLALGVSHCSSSKRQQRT